MISRRIHGKPRLSGDRIRRSDDGRVRWVTVALGLKLPLPRLSFRWQITLLGVVVAVLLLAMLFAASTALRYTKSAVLSDEKRSLSDTAYGLAREYGNNMEFAQQNHDLSPLENPAEQFSQEILKLLSRAFLRNDDGIEGGFYSKAGDSLVGDSSPIPEETEESLGQRIVPADVAPAIFQVARAALLTHQLSEQVLTGVHEIVLIEAVPIRGGQEYIGSAWTMKRLLAIPGANRLRTYLIAVGLGAAALACVLLTLLVVRSLQSGVRKIEGGLESLERNLGSQIPTGTDPDEIQRIVQAINRVGATLKKKIERERQIEDQLRHSERLAALGRLVAGVAHEVRNPLTTIRLRVQMCQRYTDNPSVHESGAVALEEIERLNGIVNRLLTFAQPVRLTREPINLSRLAEQRLESFREKARQRDIRFITNFSDGGKALQVDQARMAQVFDNIIQNAIEAMPEPGGTIWVRVSSESETAVRSGAVCIEFRDTGRGIHPDVVGRIFDPFFTTKTSGTGLGLSICHELVRAHDGEIHVESSEGHGTNIRILLPFRNSEVTIL